MIREEKRGMKRGEKENILLTISSHSNSTSSILSQFLANKVISVVSGDV
jgi:hypothetical protein